MSGLPMSWPASSLTLAIDGSTPGPSVALVRGDDVVAETTAAPEPRKGRRLMELVHHVMADGGAAPAGIGGVVVGTGPGGFTGLRIALATAAGIAQGRGVPLVGASSLEAIALGIARASEGAELLAPATDARRGQVFAAAYRRDDADGLALALAPAAMAPDELVRELGDLETPERVAGAGTGWEVYADELAAAGVVAGPACPAASDLVARVRSGAGRPAAPEYLRLPDAEEKRRAAGEG